MMLLPISKNGYNFALASLGMIILFNIVAAKPATDNVPSTTENPIQTPISCEKATALDVNVTEFLGVWFEAARKINRPNNETCNAWNFVKENNNTYYVNSTYKMNSSDVSQPSLNISFTSGSYKMSENGIDTIYKILNTDYKNFAYICSYRVDTNSTTTTTTTTAPATKAPILPTASTSSPTSSIAPTDSSSSPTPTPTTSTLSPTSSIAPTDSSSSPTPTPTTSTLSPTSSIAPTDSSSSPTSTPTKPSTRSTLSPTSSIAPTDSSSSPTPTTSTSSTTSSIAPTDSSSSPIPSTTSSKPVPQNLTSYSLTRNEPSDAFILVRNRNFTKKDVDDHITQAKQKFPFFQDLIRVDQSNCKAADNVVAGAATLMPMLTMMITVAVATVLKF